MSTFLPCPCGSNRPYAGCCAPCHDGSTPAASAEALMRSRYSAYVMGLCDYLLASWRPRTRPAALAPPAPGQRWLGLDLRRSRPIDDDHAEVEFVARSKLGGRAQRLHEVSRFVRDGGRWYYVDGDLK